MIGVVENDHVVVLHFGKAFYPVGRRLAAIVEKFEILIHPCPIA